MNEAPVLDASKTPVVDSQPEDANPPIGAVGTLVSSLVDFALPAGGVDNVTDSDAGALLGIAVTAADGSNGHWHYSIDGGTTWHYVGPVTDGAALLLAADANTRIYFEAYPDYDGQAVLTFRAWDRSDSNESGRTVDTTVNGGSTAFSVATDTVTFDVSPNNDPIVLDASKTPVGAAVFKDSGAPVGAVGTLVSSLVDFTLPAGGMDNVTDPDTGALLGIAVIGADASNGTWHYSIDGGTIWNAMGSVSDGAARLLAADASTRIYFQGKANYDGQADLTFRAWDRTGPSNGSVVPIIPLLYFSKTSDTATFDVIVNEAPVFDLNGIDAGNSVALSYTEQDAPTAIAPLAIISDLDSADFNGGSLTVARTSAVASDRLTIGSVGTGSGEISVSGDSVLYEGATIGTFAGGTNGSNLVITFTTAAATPTAVQALARSIRYENGQGDAPTSDVRTFTFTLNDGDGGASTSSAIATVDVNSVNDAPVVSAVTTLTYTEGQGPMTLWPLATLTDPDATTFRHGSLVVTLLFAQPGDVLSVANVGTGPGQISFDDEIDVVSYEGVPFASVSGTATNISMLFQASPGNGTEFAQALLRSIQFTNTSDTPSTSQRFVSVRVNDSGNTGDDLSNQSTDIFATLSVVAQNDAPQITSGDASTVAENVSTGTAVYTATATDPDSSGLSYSLSVGGDNDLFNINATTGEVTFKASPDFEAPGDVGTNNVYNITVHASDGALEATKAVAITVTDQNDVAPTITTEAALSVAENMTTVTALASTDPDTVGTSPAPFTITGGTDAALFEVSGSNLVFKSARDYETDAHSYQVEVTASDGVHQTAKLLTIALTDQNDNAPVITTEAALTVAEGALVVAALTSTDEDTVGTEPAQFSVSGGADAALFDVAAGNLVFKTARNFETDPHSYQVEVKASDGTNQTAKLLTVTLTDLSGVTITGTAGNDTVDATTTVNGQPLPTPEDDVINGLAGTDSLSGLGGNDRIDGGTGADTMIGGPGDDTYVVDDAGDGVTELENEGVDEVESSITHTLGSHVERLTLTGSQPVNGTGNSLANRITGNAMANRIAGLGGADVLNGAGGIDTVSYAASLGAVIVSLATGLGSGGDAEGDELSGFENVEGSAQNDTLTGDGEANRLDGGAGKDAMAGLAGDDTYLVDQEADAITEVAGGGTDQVISTVFLFTLPAEVENLTLAMGAGDTFGIGNGLANALLGNAGINTLVGNGGADTLDGGAGADYLLGGVGSDFYKVDDTFDLVDEGGAFPAYAGSATDFDTISSTAEWFWDVYSVGERLQIEEGAVGSGGAGTTIVGSVFSNEMIGNSGTNIMFGRGGADTYRAGDGIDWISLDLLGVTEENAYVGVDGVNTIIVDKRTTGALSYDIIFEFEVGKDKIDVSDYGYATATEVILRGHDDGLGNSYYALGDGFDYVYLVGVTTSQVQITDFVV